MSVGSPDLVWMAAVPWHGIRGTDRHLAMAMSQHARVLWVDPPASPLTPAARRGAYGRRIWPLISVIDDRLIRLTPIALPGLTRPGVRATTAPLLRGQLRWALRRLAIRPSAVVATHIEDVLGCWGSDVVSVLYGTDDYVAGAQLLGQSARWLRRQERDALACADIVAVVSQQLADRWSGLGARPVLIPNGCSRPAAAIQPLPPGARGLRWPVVGLIGQLSERIDIGLLEATADAGFSLLLVGPHSPRWEPRRFAALAARDGVHYAGPVPAAAVPSYLAAIDIGITPYRDTEFNRASFPLKTLEYLAAGRPVVATALPAARWLLGDPGLPRQPALAGEVLALASGQSAFVAALRRMAGDQCTPIRVSDGLAVGERELASSGRCREFADRHSWSRRAAAFAALIGLPPASHAQAGADGGTARMRM
ncbi:MAG TPA: glycosyltransferase [Streptosporangiaceae bacterium]|nr:glycosyltransferase [Streptosporangiaceae bacterium]